MALRVVLQAVAGVVAYLVMTAAAVVVNDPPWVYGGYAEPPNHLLMLLTAGLVAVGVGAGLRWPRPVLVAALVALALTVRSALVLYHSLGEVIGNDWFYGRFDPPWALFQRGAQTPPPLAAATAAVVAALVGLYLRRSQRPVPRPGGLRAGPRRTLGAVVGLVAYLAVTRLTLAWIDTYPVPDPATGVLVTAVVAAVGVLAGAGRPRLALPAAAVLTALVLISWPIGTDIMAIDASARNNPLAWFFVGAWTSAPLALATAAGAAAAVLPRAGR